MFGMNAKTWHSLQLDPRENPWSWLVLLPNGLRHDKYTDDLRDANNLIIHLQGETVQGTLSWRPSLRELTVTPYTLVFRGDVFLGYYYYIGFLTNEDPSKPPRVTLRRISQTV